MEPKVASGSWPTMVTPFTLSGQIDYPALERMIEWYIEGGVDGLFAVCQSSEMFFLSLEERMELANFVVKKSAGRVPVIASGHISDSLEDQIEEIRRISATGIEAFVLVSNRLAASDEDDSVWRSNAERILAAVPDVAFGIYECPYPYKRLLSPELLKWCADTGRFWFLKDTCCSLEQIRGKLAAIQSTKLKLFNANTATLLASLQLGAAGFSGVMANFHPELYTWLLKNWKTNPEQARTMQSFLTLASFVELKLYPVNAKYYMQLCGLPISTVCRSRNAEEFTELQQVEVRQLQELTSYIKSTFGMKDRRFTAS